MGIAGKTTKDMERAKFKDDENGDVAVNILGSGTFRPSGLNNGGKITVVTINNTTWTALPVTALADRNALSIQNDSTQNIKINYDNGVSGYVGITIFPNGERFYDITDDIIIYAKSETSSCEINVEELS